MSRSVWSVGSWWYKSSRGWLQWDEDARRWMSSPWEPPRPWLEEWPGQQAPPPPEEIDSRPLLSRPWGRSTSFPPPYPGPPETPPGRGRDWRRIATTLGLFVVVAVVVVGPRLVEYAGSLNSSLCDESESLLADGRVLSKRVPGTPTQLDESLMVATPPWSSIADLPQDITLAAQDHGEASVDDWQNVLADHEFIRGWKRAWTLGDAKYRDDGLLTNVFEFSDPDGAQGFQRWVIDDTCSQALEIFEVPSLPGAVGSRFAYQREPGRISDQVSFVVANRRYVVALSREGGRPDREQLFDLARGAFASATRAGDLCELLPEAFYRAAESARGGVAGRIEGLGSLIPDYAPLGFNLEHQGKDKDYLGGQKIPVYARRWFKDKEQVLLQEEVAEYPSAKMALSTFRHHAESLCQSSSAFTEPEWLMGGMLFTQQQGLNVIRHLQFIRGPRIYSVMYMGPAPDVRLEMLEAFGQRAREVAR